MRGAAKQKLWQCFDRRHGYGWIQSRSDWPFAADIFDYSGGYVKKIPVESRGVDLKESECLVVLSSGYIGSRQEANYLCKGWGWLKDVYAAYGLKSIVAPRCDDADGVSRRSLWDYSARLRDFLLSQPAGQELVLVNFSAGGPIADMGVIRAKGSPKPKPRVVATFYIEATHFGIPASLMRRFDWPRSSFLDDLDPDSRFMTEVTRFRQGRPRNCVEVCGDFSRVFPGVFGPRTDADPMDFPGLVHGELECNQRVHLEIAMRIRDILRRPMKSFFSRPMEAKTRV